MSQAASHRKDWADPFLPQQIQILATFFDLPFDSISIAPADLDYKEATDLILPGGERVSVRVRRFHQMKFSHEICFRNVPLGKQLKTEVAKIREGASRYYLTCWTDPMERNIIRWHLVDLNEFRRCQKETFFAGVTVNSYGDGDDKGLLSITLTDISPEYAVIIASNFGLKSQTEIHSDDGFRPISSLSSSA